MQSESRGAPGAAASACRGCGLRSECEVGNLEASGPFQGAVLVAVAVGYFGLPLLCALAGAFLADGEPILQLASGGGGLLLGMSIATRLAPALTRRLCAGLQGGVSG